MQYEAHDLQTLPDGSQTGGGGDAVRRGEAEGGDAGGLQRPCDQTHGLVADWSDRHEQRQVDVHGGDGIDDLGIAGETFEKPAGQDVDWGTYFAIVHGPIDALCGLDVDAAVAVSGGVLWENNCFGVHTNFAEHETKYSPMQNVRAVANGDVDGDGNNDVVVVTEAVSEPASQPASQPASEHAPESVAALIEAVEQGNTARQDQAPSEATNGNGNSEDDAKPARRAKSRRPGGSANGQNAPDKDADAAPSEDDAEPASEDTNPVGA